MATKLELEDSIDIKVICDKCFSEMQYKSHIVRRVLMIKCLCKVCMNAVTITVK